jgi:hypothetical protein
MVEPKESGPFAGVPSSVPRTQSCPSPKPQENEGFVVIAETDRNGARSGPIPSNSIRRVLDEWLTDIERAHPVRVVIARRLADELDTAQLAPYVVPRLAASLLAVMADNRLLRDVQ